MEAPHGKAPAPHALERWLARPRNEAWAVGALVLAALALRVVHVLGTRSSPLFEAPQMDALYHVEWARAWAAGQQFQPPPFFRAPLYPWFLGVLTQVFGSGLLVPRLFQAALGAGGVLATWAIARRAFDRSTGLLAGALLAVNWVAIFFDGELLLESLAVPLYLLGIWLSQPLGSKPTARGGLVAGLAWGLAIITRPNVLLLMPPLALWVALRARGGLRTALFLTLGVLAPVLPITAYNTIRGGDFVLVASQAGLNLWIGNNPVSDGSSAIVPGTRADWWGGHHDTIAQAERAEGRALRPSEVSQHYASRTLDFVRSQPRAWARLMLRKLQLFSWNVELGNNEEPLFLFERFSPLAPLRWIGFGVLAPLALAGLWVSRRGALARLPLWGYLGLYSLSVVVFFVNARFRLPIVPVLCVYAAVALCAAVTALRARRTRALALGLGLVLGLGALSYAVPRQVLERGRSNGFLILATAAAEQRDWEGARTALEAALQITPQNWIAERALGQTLRALGQQRAAQTHLQAALLLQPGDSDSLDALADLLLEELRFDDAQTLAMRLLAAAPESPRGPYALGRARFGRNELEAACEAFQSALQLDPEHFGAAYSLGIASAALGREDQAAAAFVQALNCPEPTDERFLLDAYARAVGLQRSLGRPAQTADLLERMRARFPAHPVTQALLEDS